jgi:hypothetical protein
MRRPSGPAPKGKRDAPTLPPPPKSKRAKEVKGADTKSSGIRSRRPGPKKGEGPGATVDEVTADLSKDPRRDRDD